MREVLQLAFEIPSIFDSANTISDLATQTMRVAAENGAQRYFQDQEVSKLFGAEMVSPPASQLITEVYGYEMTDWARKGLFAEILGLELSESIQRVLEHVENNGENALDIRSVKWLSGIFYFLTNGMLVRIPIERTVKIVQPVWQVMEKKLNEFGLEDEFEKIKRELGTYFPQLAEELTGESF